jgi:hypothetical protein
MDVCVRLFCVCVLCVGIDLATSWPPSNPLDRPILYSLSIYLSIYEYLSICLSIYLSMALQPLVGPWPHFDSLIFYTVGRTPWTGDQPVARPLPTHRTTQTQNKRTQTSMPWVRFEPMVRAFTRAKTVHALDRAATVTGTPFFMLKVKGKVVPMLNWLSMSHEDIWGSGGIAPPFLTSAQDAGEWWASRPGKIPPYPLARRLNGPQSRSGRCGENKTPLPGIEPLLSNF